MSKGYRVKPKQPVLNQFPEIAKAKADEETFLNSLKPDVRELVMNSAMSDALLFGPADPFNPQQISEADTLFQSNRWYLLSNMRQLLSEIYVENGLVRTICDIPVEDALRGGVEIKTQQLEPEEIEKLEAVMEEEGDLHTVAQSAKWNRLFGGAGTMVITGQDPESPLDIDSIGENDLLEFRALDLWELFWSKQNTEDYSAVIDGGNYDAKTEFYDYYGQRVHNSRVMLMKGVQAPSFVRPRLRGWGLSIIEHLVRSINQYLKSNNLTFEVLDEFKVDIFKIKGLASTLLTPKGAEKVRSRVQLANREKNFLHALTMDAEDEYQSKELSFAGISEVMNSIRMQVASDMRIPLTKLFGISAAGFSSGQEDIENYNSMIEGEIRAKTKYDIIKVIKIRCRQQFGFAPDDLTIEFAPLRVLSAEQEENVKNAKFDRLLRAKQAGEMNSKEFREGVNKDDLLPIQLDPEVEGLETFGQVDENEKTAPGNEEGGGKIDTRRSMTTPEPKEAETPKAPRNSLFDSFKFWNAKSGVKHVAVVGMIADGQILTGRRKDNGLWTFPAGHMEGQETPEEAACRECYEESGITIDERELAALAPKTVKTEKGDMMIHAFIANVDKEYARTIVDPDGEVDVWRWVPISKETDELKPENRHAKNDVVCRHIFKLFKGGSK